MEAANLQQTPQPTPAGELVVQNGRQAGVRRPLGVSTTFIGRSTRCDIRLNVNGVDPLHCLFVFGPDGLQLRDLMSEEGTFVNDRRTDQVVLSHGDIVQVGPFQFRVELTPPAAVQPDADQERDALRVQAAAIAAQQAALDEEEARLQQRRTDLQQQEEQLAAHLAEQQRQIQVWSDNTSAEREALRNDKIEQEQRLAGLEQELLQARQEVNQEHEKLTQERQRILRVFNRLRLRWQQKWSAEKEKHEQHAQRLHTEELALDTRTVKLQDREDALARQMLQFNTERELSSRELQDGRAALAGERRIWRRRRSHEYLVLKGMQRQADEAQLRLKNARRLLVDEKEAWDKQLETLQEELHGLNNRIVHQRLRIDEQAAEIDRLDTTLRQRRLEAGGSPESVPHALAVPEEPQAPVDWQRRLDGLEVLAGELADQRAQLLEQYRRLVQIQEDWTQERDHASTEMERLARRLLEQEQSLAERDQRMAQGEETLKRRQQECDGIREEMQVWRAQLNARSQQQAQEHRETLAVLGRKEAMLQEQLAQLTEIRDRWNQRRQQDIERLRVDRAAHDQLRKETHARHVAIFEATQKLEAEERILAEKTLALEQFQKDVLGRVDDPTARRRIERLRRRWLSLNATLIRNARAEHESARNELERLDAIHADLMKLNTEVPRIEATLAERQSALDELEASLNARQALLEEELAGLDSRRQHAENAPLRLQDEIDAMAHALFESPVDTAMDKAA